MDWNKLIEAVNLLGDNGKDAFMAYLWLVGARFVIGCAVALVIAWRVTSVVRNLAENAMLIKEMQHDIGCRGPLIGTEREQIRRIWKRGLMKDRGAA